MLARLDAIPGVRESRVEASGRFFLLLLEGGADEGPVVEAAASALRGRAARVPPAEAATQLAARPRGDPWLSGKEILGLSYLEARVVATATAARVAPRAGLPAEGRERLAEALRRALFAAIERIHAEGGRESTGWFYEEWPAIAAAAVEGLRARLEPDALERLAPALREAHSGRTGA